MTTILHYDLVLISLNDKKIRYMFQVKNQMFLFYFNYLELFRSSTNILEFQNSNLTHF